MSSIAKEYVRDIICKVAPLFDLEEWCYMQEDFESMAQNYFGILIPVIISGTCKGNKTEISLVLKLAPTDERYRVSGAVTHMFTREIFVYSKIFKKYNEIQYSLALPLYVIPECYYICKEFCKEALVLKNMCCDGYKPYNYSMFLDYDHISLSLKSLAKFHALSFILKKKDSQFYEEIAATCVPLTEKTNKRYMDIMLDRLRKALQAFEGTSYVPLLEYLEENHVQLIELTVYSVAKTCICHGDIWKENILFQYQNNKPIEACMVDYQTTRICSPAFDVLYLITSSTDKKLRQKHFYQLLDIYFNMLVQVLNGAGFDVQNVYPKKEFENDLKVIGPACLIVANTALWLSSGLQEEGHVRSKVTLSTKEEKEKALGSYKAIIKSIIDDFSSYNYLCNCL